MHKQKKAGNFARKTGANSQQTGANTRYRAQTGKTARLLSSNCAFWLLEGILSAVEPESCLFGRQEIFASRKMAVSTPSESCLSLDRGLAMVGEQLKSKNTMDLDDAIAESRLECTAEVIRLA